MKALLTLLLTALLLLTSLPTQAQITLPRWQEYSFGLSFQPPEGATIRRQDQTRSMVTFDLPDITLDVNLYTWTEEQLNQDGIDDGITLNKIVDQIHRDVLGGAVSPIILDEQELSVLDLPGRMVFYQTQTLDEQQFWVAYAAILLDSYTTAIFKMETPLANQANGQAYLQQILASIELMAPQALDTLRRNQLQAGSDWLENQDTRLLELDLVAEQWMRIVRGDHEIGYMRIREAIDERTFGTRGFAVEQLSRVYDGPFVWIQERESFLSTDGQLEFWNNMQWRSPVQENQFQQDRPIVWEESGIRNASVIEVERKLPQEHPQPNEWARPETAYLSQAELWMRLRRPPREDTEMAFYAYREFAGEISYVTVRIEQQPVSQAQPSRTYHMYVRLSLREPEQLWVFNRSGQLLAIYTPDGREMYPSTLEELQNIWDIP